MPIKLNEVNSLTLARQEEGCFLMNIERQDSGKKELEQISHVGKQNRTMRRCKLWYRQRLEVRLDFPSSWVQEERRSFLLECGSSCMTSSVVPPTRGRSSHMCITNTPHAVRSIFPIAQIACALVIVQILCLAYRASSR